MPMSTARNTTPASQRSHAKPAYAMARRGMRTGSRSLRGPIGAPARYSHVRMEAKRRALDEIAARQRGADEKRKAEAERPEPSTSVSGRGGPIVWAWYRWVVEGLRLNFCALHPLHPDDRPIAVQCSRSGRSSGLTPSGSG
jgi:hypothetical protein